MLIMFLCSVGMANKCGSPPSVDNATVIVNVTSTPFVEAVYSCDKRNGFVLNGNDSIYCVHLPAFGYSLWSSVNFTCDSK